MPEEVAALAVMLASDEAGYVTGAELTIDGDCLLDRRRRQAKHNGKRR